MLLACSAHADNGFESVKKAAEQGDAEAQFNLGYMYANGEGVQKTMPRPCAGSARLLSRDMLLRNSS